MNHQAEDEATAAAAVAMTKTKKSPTKIGAKAKVEEVRSDDVPQTIVPHQCLICLKCYANSSVLYRHMRMMHKAQIAPHHAKSIKCTACGEEYRFMAPLIKHLITIHDMILIPETLTFSSNDEFLKWKLIMERNTHSLYVKESSQRTISIGLKQTYSCHRSGQFLSKSTGKRNIKAQGTNKINATCPSHITTITRPDESIEVQYWKEHHGHTIEPFRIPPSKRGETGNEATVMETIETTTTTTSNETLNVEVQKVSLNALWGTIKEHVGGHQLSLVQKVMEDSGDCHLHVKTDSEEPNMSNTTVIVLSKDLINSLPEDEQRQIWYNDTKDRSCIPDELRQQVKDKMDQVYARMEQVGTVEAFNFVSEALAHIEENLNAADASAQQQQLANLHEQLEGTGQEVEDEQCL